APITCAAIDQCHAAGACDPATASCSNPALPDGTSCSDGDGCTLNDACVAGACSSGPYEFCDGICDPATGVCTLWPAIALGAVTLHPSAFYLMTGNFSTSTLSPDVQLQLVSASIDPMTGARETVEPVSAAVNVAIASSRANVGWADPAHFAAGAAAATSVFHA